jgi:hypothetical protein
MKKIISKLCVYAIILAPFFITGCSKDYYGITEVDLNDTISFSATLKPMFESNCTASGCHNTGGIAPDLTPDYAYSNLILYNLVDIDVPENSVLYVRMNATSSPMPPSGKLSDYEISQVLAWITQGANDN